MIVIMKRRLLLFSRPGFAYSGLEYDQSRRTSDSPCLSLALRRVFKYKTGPHTVDVDPAA